MTWSYSWDPDQALPPPCVLSVLPHYTRRLSLPGEADPWAGGIRTQRAELVAESQILEVLSKEILLD